MENDADRTERIADESAEAELQALKERMAELERRLAFQKAEAEVEVVEPRGDEETPDAPQAARVVTDADREKADQLIREYRLAKMRGQSTLALDLLRKAEALAPDLPGIREAVGDDLAEKLRFKDALQAYTAALKQDPTNINLQRKHAEMVLKANEMDLTLVGAGFGGSRLDPEAYANPRAAVWLNLFLPGAGQIVTGNQTKGILMLVGWVGAWIWAIATPNGIQGLLAFAGLGRSLSEQPNMTVLVPLAIAGGLHLWALFDISHLAEVHKASQRSTARPKPPVDLPFE